MKNKYMKNVLKILLILSVLSTTIIAYAKEDYNYIDDKGIIVEKVEKKVSKVEKKEEKQEVQNTTPIVQNNTTRQENTYSQPAISGNSINIPGVLNKHLMKDDGSYYYLDRNINGVYDGIGVPFIDSRNNFYTRKTIIYAHSSPYGNGPFQALQNYHKNKGYYDAHKYITINYNGNTYNYLIFSVYVSLANSEEEEGLEYFQNMDYNNYEWGNAINRYKSHSEYETGVSVNSNDKIIILQTCSMDPAYYEKYYRYNLLIMGKLV